MDFLLKQSIDKNNFNVFIRDLSLNLNTNLKHIIEDTITFSNKSNNNKGYNNNKKKVVKKADLIRADVNKKKEEKLIQNDIDKLEFLFNNKDINNPFSTIKLLKSNKGIEKMKFMLLDFYWNNHKKTHMNYIISLYYQLKDSSNPDYKELLNSIGGKLEKYEYKLYMMKELGYL